MSDDDGTCMAQHPADPEVRCGRKAGHGPGDYHDSWFHSRLLLDQIPHLWPNLEDGHAAQ